MTVATFLDTRQIYGMTYNKQSERIWELIVSGERGPMEGERDARSRAARLVRRTGPGDSEVAPGALAGEPQAHLVYLA